MQGIQAEVLPWLWFWYCIYVLCKVLGTNLCRMCELVLILISVLPSSVSLYHCTYSSDFQTTTVQQYCIHYVVHVRISSSVSALHLICNLAWCVWWQTHTWYYFAKSSSSPPSSFMCMRAHTHTNTHTLKCKC